MSHPECLSPQIARVWQRLGVLPDDQYILIGGTALCYQIGHRISDDIDLSTHHPCHHPRIIRAALNIPELGAHKWIRRKPDHFIRFQKTDETPKLDIHGKINMPCLDTPQRADSGLRLASLPDILFHKLIAMSERMETRDGEDVVALLEYGLDPAHALNAIHTFFEIKDPGIDIRQRLLSNLDPACITLSRWPDNPLLHELRALIATHKPVTITFTSPYIEGPDDLP